MDRARFFTPRMPTRRATAPGPFGKKHRVALGVRSERGREERLLVSARRVHDAARERRIPWSVTLTSSSGCPDPRRSTGHSLLHPLGALSLLGGPTSVTEVAREENLFSGMNLEGCYTAPFPPLLTALSRQGASLSSDAFCERAG